MSVTKTTPLQEMASVLAEALRAVAKRASDEFERGERSAVVDLSDISETLLAVADEILDNVPAPD